MNALQLLALALACFLPIVAGLMVIAAPVLSSMISQREEATRRP